MTRTAVLRTWRIKLHQAYSTTFNKHPVISSLFDTCSQCIFIYCFIDLLMHWRLWVIFVLDRNIKVFNMRERRYIKLHKLTCKIVRCILKSNFVLRHWFKHIWLTARTDGTSVVAKHNTWFGTVCYRIRTIRLLFVGYTCKTYLNEKKL